MFDQKFSLDCASEPKVKSKVIREDQPTQNFEELYEDMKKQLAEANSEKEHYRNQYNEYMMEAIKYRNAFQAVMEELKK